MKRLLSFGVIAFCQSLYGQISVYECNAENSTMTQQELLNNQPEINKPCAWFDSQLPYIFIGNQQKTINATNEIHIKTNTHIKPVGNGEMHLKAGNKGLFEVFCMNYPDMLHVLKYEKFELGITLPLSVQEKIDRFINEDGISGPDKINPYLDWDIRVSFDFTHPQIPYTITVDGFYNKEYESWMTPESEIPEYSEPQPNYVIENFPLLNLYGVYNTLGGYTEIPTEYPFLGRFSPPRTGKWKCEVHIYLPNNETYSADPFYFTVVQSDNPGYVKVANDARSLELGGDPFYPVGANVLWPMTYETKNNPGTVSPKLQKLLIDPNNGFVSEEYRSLHPLPVLYNNYRNLIRNMADGGANFVRLIMHPFSIDIEFDKLGNYTDRLYQAQELDEILEYCESRNVYIDWDMMIHYVHQQNSYNIGWYNTLEGKSYGYKSLPDINNEPVNFFTNEVSKAFYKQRLRYILARWGYSTNIAMFELYSEIGNEYTTPERAVINKEWQSEMAAYISERSNGITHLIQPSYAGIKVKADKTFRDENIDVMTTNIYPGLKCFARNWMDHIQRDYMDQTTPWLDSTYAVHCQTNINQPGITCFTNTKPFFMPEFNPTSELCDNNQIEVRRSMWQAPFSGAVGALSWYSYKNGAVFSEYSKIRTFLENMNGKGNWHPGAMNFTDNRWIYIDYWADDMDKPSKKADLMYMRSNNLDYAIGVITNKTYNIETANGCIEDDSWPPVFNDLMNGSPETIETRTEDIFLNGMKDNRDYHVDYFHLYDLSAPFQSETEEGSRIKLKTSVGRTADDYIVLFLARKSGAPLWLPKQDEITQLLNNSVSREILEKDYGLAAEEIGVKDFEIDVYPVPATDIISIDLNDLENNVSLEIVSTEGKTIRSIMLEARLSEIDIRGLEKGVYGLKFFSGETLIQHRKIVKL